MADEDIADLWNEHMVSSGGVRRGTYDHFKAAISAAEAAERERNAGWFALVMNAAAALEDAANCLRDPDAKRAAEGAAKHYREAANAMWAECVGPNDRAVATKEAPGYDH